MSSPAPASVLILFTSAERGGAEEYVLRLARYLRRRGSAVHTAFPDHPATRGLRAELTALGCETHVVPASTPARDGAWPALRAILTQARAVRRLVGRLRPQTVLVSLPFPEAAPGALLGCALTPRVRAAVLFHLARPDLTVTRGRRAMYALARARQRWFAVSSTTAGNVARAFGCRADAIGVLPNGTDVADLRGRAEAARRDERRARTRAALGVAADATMVVTVGRLSPQKDPSTFVEAARLTATGDARSHTAFVWVGEGPLRGEVEEATRLAGLCDVVRFPGQTDDVSAFLVAADVFVLASRLEGMPFAVLEAFSHGVACVLSEPASIDGAHDGVHVLTVPPGDPVALARAIRRLIEDPALRARLADAAGDLVQRYDAEVTFAQTARSLVVRRPRPDQTRA